MKLLCALLVTLMGAIDPNDLIAGIDAGIEIAERDKPLPDPERDERVARSTADIWAFRRTYLPHLFRVAPAPCHLEDEIELERHELFAAGDPRYHAKTTRHTLSRPLWEAVTGRVTYIIIVRDDSQHVEESILSIRHELEDNVKLRADYGDLTGSSPWRQDQLVLSNGAKILGLTKGQPIPGVLWAGVRVQRIYIDDPQTIADVQSEAQRRKDQEWLDNDVLPAREQGGKVVMCQNTIHPDCLIEHFRKKPLCYSRKYDAIVHEPNHQKLWHRWEKLLTAPEASLSDRQARADRFYRRHEKKMLAGVRVLWPAQWTYLGLMRQKLTLGSIIFYVQFRNRPFTGDRARWVARWSDVPEDAAVYEGFDLATRQGSCFFAKVQIAVDREGRVFVREAFRDHLSFAAQYSLVIAPPDDERLVVRGIEDNAYQAVLPDEASRHSLAGGATIRPVTSRLAPELRCIKLWFLMENGKLLFGTGPVMDELVEQATGFREGQKLPDLLSALEIAVRVALDNAGHGAALVPLGDVIPA